MNLRDFRQAGHTPTLFSAFLYFDISFMVWVMVGALANSIVVDFGLSAAEKGFMVAIPILGGAVLRLSESNRRRLAASERAFQRRSKVSCSLRAASPVRPESLTMRWPMVSLVDATTVACWVRRSPSTKGPTRLPKVY